MCGIAGIAGMKDTASADRLSGRLSLTHPLVGCQYIDCFTSLTQPDDTTTVAPKLPPAPRVASENGILDLPAARPQAAN